jgi:hypothetical protein
MPTYYKRDITGTTNWNSATSWSTISSTSSFNGGTFPSSTTADPVIFDANSSACTVNVASTCTSLTLTGYANTITFTNTLTVSGNVTLSNAVGAVYNGPNGILINAATATMTFAGANYNLPFSIFRPNNTGTSTITFADSGQVSDFTVSTGGGNSQITLAGSSSNLSVSRNLACAGTTNQFATSAAMSPSSNITIILNGTGNISGVVRCNLTFNTTSAVTLIGNLEFDNRSAVTRTLLYTNGTINWGIFGLIFYSQSSITNINFTYAITNLTFYANSGTGNAYTLLSNLNVTNLSTAILPSASGGNTLQINGFNIDVNGNFTGTQPCWGTTKIWMIGTGNISISTGNDLEINSPLGAINVVGLSFFANNRLTAGVTFTYTSALSYTQPGTITFADGVFTINNPGNGNFQTLSFSTRQNFPAVGATLNHSITCTTLNFATSAGLGISLFGNTIFLSGNLTRTSTPVISGTTTVNFIGGVGTATWAGLFYGINFEINKNVSFTENIVFTTSGRSVVVNSGTVSPNATTVTTSNSVNMTISGMTFWNLTLPGNAIITQNIVNTIQNNLVINTFSSITFAGTAGWITNNFTYSLPATTCTLQAGVTYIVNGIFTMNGTSSASRSVLQSSDAVAVTVSIPASPSLSMTVNVGSIPSPAAGYVLGSTSTALPPILNNLLPDRPTIASGAASPYTLVNPIGATPLTSFAGTVGKKAFFIVTNGTGSTNVSYVTTRDIDSNGGITILAFGSYSDQIGNPTANLFRTLNWGPLIAPSGSAYFTFVN